MKDGVYHQRHFYSIDDTPQNVDSAGEISVSLPSKIMLPDKELMSKEFYQELFKRVDEYASGHRTGWSVDTTVLRRFLELIDDGYTYPEICEEMGMSAQRLHYYKKKLQKIIKQMEMKSPFNGHRIPIKMKITRKTYEAHPEKYAEFVYDADRDCDFNEAYMITVNPQGEYLLIREKGD